MGQELHLGTVVASRLKHDCGRVLLLHLRRRVMDGCALIAARSMHMLEPPVSATQQQRERAGQEQQLGAVVHCTNYKA